MPSTDAAAGGLRWEDAVYNGIHPFLGETDGASPRAWIATPDRLEGRRVAPPLYDAMLSPYPGHANPGALWGAADAAGLTPAVPVTRNPRLMGS